MNRKVLGVVLVVVGLAALGASVVDQRTSGSRIMVLGLDGRPTIATPGKPWVGSFTVFNYRPYRIHVEVVGGCGCETLSPLNFDLDLLHRQVVKFRIDSSGFEPGNYDKSVVLKCRIGNETWDEPLKIPVKIVEKKS